MPGTSKLAPSCFLSSDLQVTSFGAGYDDVFGGAGGGLGGDDELGAGVVDGTGSE